MQYRRMGASEFAVSEVGFGLWTVSNNLWGIRDPDEGIQLLQQAWELGVTLFDTADTYGEGIGEEILAKALGSHRHDIIIATKFGYDIYSPRQVNGQQEVSQNFEPAYVRYACEQSLRRLRTDYIDLYQLHNPQISAFEQDDLFFLLEALVQEGKIRAYGTTLGPDLRGMEEGCEVMPQRPIASLQIIYSILEQLPARTFFPVASDRKIGLLARVPHASDTLTEEFKRSVQGFVGNAAQGNLEKEWHEQEAEKLAKIDFLTQHHPLPLDQLAITFGLAESSVTTILPNITSQQQLRLYSEASDLERPCPECIRYLKELFDQGLLSDSTLVT